MVELTARMAFIGVSRGPARWDPNKIIREVLFSKGTGSLSFQIDQEQYEYFSSWEEFTRCEVLVDYNPLASKVAYCMTFLKAVPLEDIYPANPAPGTAPTPAPAASDPDNKPVQSGQPKQSSKAS